MLYNAILERFKSPYFLEMYTKVCMSQGDIWDFVFKIFYQREKKEKKDT